MKMLYRVVTGLIIALGVLHSFVTFVEFNSFSPRAVFFFGAGISIIFAGFINLIRLHDTSEDKLIKVVSVLTNAICTLMFGVTILVLPQPQVFIGTALFLTASVLALTKTFNSDDKGF